MLVVSDFRFYAIPVVLDDDGRRARRLHVDDAFDDARLGWRSRGATDGKQRKR